MTDIVSTSIDGFDPLEGEGYAQDASMTKFFEDANRRVILNILKSYTGYYDLFSEILQNSLDAVQMRRDLEIGGAYVPTLWITIDIPGRRIRVVDNGVGMDAREFKFCLRPNVSFKDALDLRGHKGVGATFLAYGFSFLRLQSKKDNTPIAAILRQGRQWAEDQSDTIPRPKFEAIKFDVPELAKDRSGTCLEIMVGQSPAERPADLGWIAAHTADQWYDVLRLKTPLGGVYLRTPPFSPTVYLNVVSASGTVTTKTVARAEYYYPHEIPNLKGQSIRDIKNAVDAISGDPSTKFNRLSPDFKRLDCVYDIWAKDEILEESSYFESALDPSDRQLVEKHNVIVYACFLRSAKLWTEFNDEILKLRKGQRIVHGGLQIATDFMVQGDLIVIPLTSAIGYQANSHVIVHFTDGNPDMGRKVFQPELKHLSEKLAVRSVNIMRRYYDHVKPDTGVQSITPDKELHEWKKAQEIFRDKHPLTFTYGGRDIAVISTPQQEQDVIALFHELLGIGVLKGLKFYATSQSDRYDSLFHLDYSQSTGVVFDNSHNRLGVSPAMPLPHSSEPKVLEYKYTFDSLVDDLDKDLKFTKQINLVVCWQVGRGYKERFSLQSLLVGDEGASRTIFGSTHKAFLVGAQSEAAFELIVLEDLLQWHHDPKSEEARQKHLYRD